MLTEKEFDILTALEAAKRPLSQRAIAAGAKISLGIVNKTMATLAENGLIENGTITEKGLAALEPYRVKRAVFLAAGFGSRLVPITLNTPKPLVRVKGKRIIDTLLDAIVSVGINEIYIVRGYLGEQFNQLLPKYPNLVFIDNPLYMEANNISSALAARHFLENAYVCEADLLPWTRKICFKESFEGNFGVHVTVSERLSATQLRKAMRFIAGKSLDIGADAVEDAIPMPVVDEIAVQPLIYLSKQLLTTTQAKIIAEGYLDLKAAQFSDTPSLISIPLFSCRKITINGKQTMKENEPDGSVELSAIAI